MIKERATIKTILIAILVIGVVTLFIVLSGTQNRLVKIAGIVVDPVTDTPVSGIDLVVGDTNIRTSDSGNFVFPAVDTHTGIRLTHPDLLRAVVVLPAKGTSDKSSDIFFNTELLNTLITIVDMEARDNIEAIYEFLLPEIKEQLSKEEFRKEFEQFFVKENITDQEITIRGMSRDSDYFNKKFDTRLKDVIEFELILGKENKWYRFIWEDDLEIPTWTLLF